LCAIGFGLACCTRTANRRLIQRGHQDRPQNTKAKRPEPSRFCRQATFGQSNAKSIRARVTTMTTKTETIRALNDELRQNLTVGTALITAGVAAQRIA
jgi:hypothetical protein